MVARRTTSRAGSSGVNAPVCALTLQDRGRRTLFRFEWSRPRLRGRVPSVSLNPADPRRRAFEAKSPHKVVREATATPLRSGADRTADAVTSWRPEEHRGGTADGRGGGEALPLPPGLDAVQEDGEGAHLL